MSKPNIFNPKLVAEAKSKGLQIIGAGKNRQYRTYKLKCWHEIELRPGNVRNNVFSCKSCVNDKKNNDAALAGLKWISKGKNRNYGIYQFLSCGHEQEIDRGQVRKKEVKCPACSLNTYKKEAVRAGVKLIDNSPREHYRLYELLCGHQQEMQIGNVRKKSFVCRQCNETIRDQPSKVYLFRITSGVFNWLKLGHTKSIENRISWYGLPENSRVEILTVIDFNTGDAALSFESSIHKTYKRHKLSKDMMIKYHTLNGFTECYPSSMVSILVKEISSRR